MATPSEPIAFYDIASAPPISSFAVNPWKTRMALNFKKLQYKTHWTDLTQVTEVRKSLGAAPVRKHWVDDSDFYTLPAIVDPSTGAVVGDSFDIAVYLDKTYPTSGGTLIPPNTQGLLKVFNSFVDQIFSGRTALCLRHFPFNPETADISKAEFCRRSGAKSFDDILQYAEGENRQKLLVELEKALREAPFKLDSLSKCYLNQDEGPFLNGKEPMYADIIVGAWLQMFKICLPKEEWEMLSKEWQGGMWGRMYDALEEYKTVDTPSNRDG